MQDPLAEFGRNLYLQAFLERNGVAKKPMPQVAQIGAHLCDTILEEAKRRGIPQPVWDGIDWSVPNG